MEERRLLSVVNWVGAEGGGDGVTWGNASNWESGTVPQSGDDVYIVSAAGDITGVGGSINSLHSSQSNVSLDVTGVFSIASDSEVAGYLTIAGGLLNNSGKLTVAGGLSVDGGELEGAGDVTVTNAFNLDNGGALLDTGTLTVNGLFTWTGGSILGSGTTNAMGGMNISGAGLTFENGTINSAGQVTWAGGSILGDNGPTWNNDGTFNAQTDSEFLLWDGEGPQPVLNNHGTFIQSVGSSTGLTTYDAVINNSGLWCPGGRYPPA